MRRLARGAGLVVASHNRGKCAEIAALLAPFGLAVRAAADLGLAEPEETGADFAANARLKAVAAARACGVAALADDSGFCVAGLGGAPGVLSARWAREAGGFPAAMARVEAELGAGSPRAWFVCALALAWPDGESATFQGRVEGCAVFPPRGARGFGYDPIFRPLGGRLTYGELAPEAKESDSHRARAFAALSAACLPAACLPGP